MKRLFILASICMLASLAHAAGRQEWYVIKADDGAYAFDAESVETDIGSGAKTVSVVTDINGSHTSASYTVDCRLHQGEFAGSMTINDTTKTEDMLMAEGNGKPT